MLTDFQKKKLGRLFNALDSDGNGQLERNDYTKIVENLARIDGWQSGSEEYAALEALYMTIWGNLKALADIDNNGQVSLDEFLDFHAQMLSSPEMFDQLTIGTLELLFDPFDRDRDGNISPQDFAQFFSAYGIDQSAADEAFRKMDGNGDGKISKEEAAERVKEFYFSQDPAAAGNWLFGRYQ
jgi:Ca2+-binding EF-hand superfamily protein